MIADNNNPTKKTYSIDNTNSRLNPIISDAFKSPVNYSFIA